MNDSTLPEKGRVALVTIGAQRDCMLKGSPVMASDARRAAIAIGRLAAGFRRQGAPIVHSVRLYRPDGSNVDLCRRQAVEEGLRILMPGTFGTELAEGLAPSPEIRLDPNRLLDGGAQKLDRNEWALYKPRWGAFFGTKLEDHLRGLNVTTVVLSGCNVRTAIRATVYEASARDFRIVVATDGVSGASEEALSELGRMGIYLMTADSCLTWLSGAADSNAAA